MPLLAAPEPAVRLVGVSRHYGEVRAVDQVTLEVEDGEFFALLGPSGSGKTTCLRLIAGFEQPSQGAIELSGRDVTALPPFERDVNTVFQDYALFPHMTVAENVGYGLRIKKIEKAEIRRRVNEALALVRLPEVGGRKPAQLSGGQRQRIALARALVNRPHVLLLDEPLGALDLKLRQQMQVELKAIQREVGITFLLVTHDQEEALAMSDRLAVFNQGRIEQVGRPAEVYERPRTPFVAGFVGVSNVISGGFAEALLGSPAPCSLRPEKVRICSPDAPSEAGACVVDGRVRDVVYLGAYTRYLVALDLGPDLIVVEQNLSHDSLDALAARNQRVRLQWQREHARPLETPPAATSSPAQRLHEP